MKKIISYVAVFVIGFGACALILDRLYFTNGSDGLSNGPSLIQNLTRKSPKPIVRKGDNPIADAVTEVGPAIVSIDVSAERNVPNPFGGMFGIPLPPQRQVLQGEGSGVIIDKNGIVLTNNHVIAGAQKIRVILLDGRKFSAKVLARDSRADLAIIKVNAKNLPYAQLGDSDALRVGDWAIAIGNPVGLENTVTVGVISATKRRNLPIEEAIQTDAAINPGNSGGALINVNGEVIGINTAIYTPPGQKGSIGLGFAIPSNYAKDIVLRLKKNGSAVYPFLGVAPDNLSGDLATWYKQNGFTGKGAMIREVLVGSPAAKAGLRQGDVITGIDKNKVESAEDVTKIVKNCKVGQVVRISIWREGKTSLIAAKLDELSDDVQ